jgi:hypothetical protein
MPWINENVHVTFGPDASKLTPKELRAAVTEWEKAADKFRGQHDQARAALKDLPFVAVPIEQLADIYSRFRRLTRMGVATVEEWSAMSKEVADLRHAIFREADFGAVQAGQWLPHDVHSAAFDASNKTTAE